jgi:hypothetical protein
MATRTKGDREGRPYKDYDYDVAALHIFVGATLAVALQGGWMPFFELGVTLSLPGTGSR